MGPIFGMAELQLRISGRPVTEEKMDTLVERYPLKNNDMYMCRMGPIFQEPIDDDDGMTDEEDGSNKDEFEATSTRDNASDTS